MATRRDAREQAFLILFGMNFTKETPEEQMRLFSEEEDMDIFPYAKELVLGVTEKERQLDEEIKQYLRRWTKERISKISLTLLRLSLYEINEEESVPASVAINEAVELAKNFGSDEDAPFVNGILGSIVKTKNPEEVFVKNE